jgi:hypothetical protein
MEGKGRTSGDGLAEKNEARLADARFALSIITQ